MHNCFKNLIFINSVQCTIINFDKSIYNKTSTRIFFIRFSIQIQENTTATALRVAAAAHCHTYCLVDRKFTITTLFKASKTYDEKGFKEGMPKN